MTKDPPDRNLLGPWTPLALVLVVAAIGFGVFSLLRATGRDREPAELDDAFVYDVERYRRIPPERIGWREVARIETGHATATALAVGPGDAIATAGDGRILVHSPDGRLLETIPIAETVRALAASPGGDLLVATDNRVGRCAFRGPIAWLATIPGEKARITSIAADRSSIYVADAGVRSVWRLEPDGRLAGRIGDRDKARDIPGFSVPSPYFDLLVAPDGLLRVVDPGRHEIDAFTPQGDLELRWGKRSFELDGFSGCCNPAHLAMLPDGRFVTSEKGIPRIKVYDVDGTFLDAVVGGEGLDTETDPCDVATDRRGRIVVLDPGKGIVRIYEPKAGPADGR